MDARLVQGHPGRSPKAAPYRAFFDTHTHTHTGAHKHSKKLHKHTSETHIHPYTFSFARAKTGQDGLPSTCIGLPLGGRWMVRGPYRIHGRRINSRCDRRVRFIFVSDRASHARPTAHRPKNARRPEVDSFYSGVFFLFFFFLTISSSKFIPRYTDDDPVNGTQYTTYDGCTGFVLFFRLFAKRSIEADRSHAVSSFQPSSAASGARAGHDMDFRLTQVNR